VNFGRFTNGLNYVDYLASTLGLSVTPSTSGGHNYAYGSACTDSNPIPGALGLLQQRNVYLAGLGPGGTADPSALYIVWTGANNLKDVIQGVVPPQDAQASLQAALGDVGNVIGSIAGAGARNILVPNMPNLGLVPLVTQGGPPVQAVTDLAAAFNVGLDTVLNQVQAHVPSVDLIRFDDFDLLTEAYTHPSEFGFTNVTTACYSKFVESGGTVCPNPAEYLSWDGFHPTTFTDQILAAEMLAAIPEPGSLALLAIALVACRFTLRVGKCMHLKAE
jgi:phospholipase/lecithinase/hemolysin